MIMLGQRYIETRQRLADVVDSVKRLARTTHADYAELDLEEIDNALKSSLRIVICGEIGAGKSSFASGLLGLRFEPIEDSTLIGYGSSVIWRGEGRQAISYHQIPELGEIEVVECRGMDRLDPAQAEVLEGLLKHADAVYWVVSSENPWAAKTWDFITKMRDVCMPQSSVVLQKVDLLKKKDIEILTGHLGSLCVQRVGEKLPIYCVSAHLAAKAWQVGPRDRRLWARSGFDACESALDHAFNFGEKRRFELQSISDRAKLVVDSIDKTIRQRARHLHEDGRALQNVEAEISKAREREIANAKENLCDLASVLSENVENTVKYAHWKNGFISTLIAIFGRGDGALDIERRLQQGVSEAVVVRSREIAFGLLEKCEAHWHELRESLQHRMAVDVVGFDTATFERNVEIFSENMEKSAERAMIMLKLRRLLDSMMVERQQVLRKMMKWFLAFVSLAGLLGWSDVSAHTRLPWLALIVAAMIALWMIFYGYRTRKEILSTYYDTVMNSRLKLANLLRQPYAEQVRYFYSGYTSMFENLRRYIVSSEEKLTPQEELWHDLFLSLKAIDQEIR